ncbi:MAG: hypothetical protein E7510_09415 [Ruminococcus sp.]|nr:hypothetical protein [Ruminococcus sp.]
MDICNNIMSPWLIMGDETKYIFAKWCGDIIDGITNEQLRSKEVFIYYDLLTHVEIGKDSISIYSNKLIPGSYAYIPTRNDIYTPSNVHSTTILVFEGFPFGKDTTKNLTENWRSSNHSVLNILMDLPIRQGSTDLQLSINPAEEIEKEYIDNGLATLRINEMSDIADVFYWHEDIITHWKLKAENELKLFRSKIDEYSFEYFDWIVDTTDTAHMLSTKELYKISSLAGVCKMKEKNVSIQQRYRQTIEQLIFESADFELLLHSFSQICQCIVWPMDSEKLHEKAKKELKKAFFVEMDKLFENDADISVSLLTEDLFEEIITDKTGKLYGINERINELISNFFGISNHESNTVVQFFTEFMEAYFRKMEDLLA